MNALTPWLIALLAIAFGVGLAWAWWAHRQRLAEMQRRLAWNEQSRFELERQTQALDERLATMAQALKTLASARQAVQPAAPAWPDTEPLRDTEVPRPALAPRASDTSAADQAAGAQAFAETMPASLEDLGQLSSPPPAKARVLPFRR
jgi:uncharacterized membrane-anchored protein YhcB (DUF1043 family)